MRSNPINLSPGHNLSPASEVCVRVSLVGKYFPRAAAGGSSFSVIRRRLGKTEEADRTEPFKALDKISFDVDMGEMVGLVGHNGAGKTTLLKVIAGLYKPTHGEVFVRGRLGLLSGLGVGMVTDLSVRDNIYLYASICRISRTRVSELFTEILEWSELADFVQEPFRNLSAGMKTRLAFAIAIHNEAEVLLIDEALSAGDSSFKQKCNLYFQSLREGPATALVSTHDMAFVEEFCNKTLWLHHGKLVAYGPTTQVLPEFLRNE